MKGRKRWECCIFSRYLCAAAWKKSFAVREGKTGCNAIFLVMPSIRGRKVFTLEGFSLITALTQAVLD
jgi:hypothetical protein